jgi:entericidin B
MKKLLVVVSALMLSISLSACNTVRGFGQDVERGGEKVQSTSERVQSNNR